MIRKWSQRKADSRGRFSKVLSLIELKLIESSLKCLLVMKGIHLPVSRRVQGRVRRTVNVLNVRGVNRGIGAESLVPAHCVQINSIKLSHLSITARKRVTATPGRRATDSQRRQRDEDDVKNNNNTKQSRQSSKKGCHGNARVARALYSRSPSNNASFPVAPLPWQPL